MSLLKKYLPLSIQGLILLVTLNFLILPARAQCGEQGLTANPNITSGCPGQATITYTFNPGGMQVVSEPSWRLEPLNAGTLSNSTGLTTTVTWQQPGTARVIVTYPVDENGTVVERCSDKSFTLLSVSTGSISGPGFVCSGGSFTLQAQGATDPEALVWQQCTAGSGCSIASNWVSAVGTKSGNTFAITGITTTTRYRTNIVWTTCDGQTYYSAEKLVSVGSGSALHVEINDPGPMCSNDARALVFSLQEGVSNTGSNPTFRWLRNGAFNQDEPYGIGDTNPDPKVYDPYDETYGFQIGESVTIEVTSDNPCDSNNPASHTVTITQQTETFPTLNNIQYSPDPICTGKNIAFSVGTTPGGNISGDWTLGPGGFASSGVQYLLTAEDILSMGNPSERVVNFSGTITGSCGTAQTVSTSTTVLTVYQTPQAFGNNDELCSGEATSINLSSDVGGTGFNWTVTHNNVSGPGGPGSGSNIAQILTTTSSVAGNARYSITPTSPDGCVGNILVLTATVNPNPTNPVVSIGPYCDFEVLTLTAVPSGNIVDFKWYNSSQTFLGQSLDHPVDVMPTGTYSYQYRVVDILGCTSDTFGQVNVNVVSSCEDKLNWIETIAYTSDPDNTSNPEVIVSHSKSYFDLSGRLAQTQVKKLYNNQVWITQTIKDEYGRDVINTLSALANQSSFQYKHWFVTDAAGNLYNHTKFEEPVGNSLRGTLGWYYSAANDMETNVPETGYPFSRTEFYRDGSGEIRKSAGPGEKLRMGQGHEVMSGTFPVFGELTDYSSRRNTVFGLVTPPISFANGAVQSVSRDENGRYMIQITDKSGKTVMTGRQGTATDKTLTLSSTVTSSADPASNNYRLMTYFYILHPQSLAISGAGYTVENILTDQVVSNPAEELPAGFYRIILDPGVITNNVTFTYTNYVLDVSYQFYDDAGRLRCSISPNGLKALVDGKPYEKIDKTTYQYNHQGWLLSMTEPDAGTTQYMYRKDGKIRFSQNALQAQNQAEANGKGRFSYTLYDELGRPVESGEYTGTTHTFSSVASQLEYAAQVELSAADKKDWVKTHYDKPDPAMPALPTGLEQDFLRGAVSWTENINIKTWYSYDEFGRVTWMAQRPAALDRIFVTKYEYDFLGNVLEVLNASCISGNLQFPFYHHYQYDADQRLAQVFTSTDGSTKKLRATYEYYLHGPLKRIELGDQIQGIDFVYNIHGWLTQINHPDKTLDPGGDSNDVFGMVLDYYESALTNLFQTSMAPGAMDPNDYHKVLDPDRMLRNHDLAYGSQLALRLGESDWRNSIKAVLEGKPSEK